VGVNDRYPVPESDPIVRLSERIRELERRVNELSGARPMQHTALTEGTFRVRDPNTSVDPVRIGVIHGEGGVDHYGIMLVDEGGVRFEVSIQDGMQMPALPLISIPQKTLGAGPFVVTTSATFETVYRATATTTHKGVTFRGVVLTAASTVGEVRLQHAGTGATTGVISCPAGGQTNPVFQWLHGQPLGTGPHAFDLQARRVSGAGNVTVFWPDLAAMIGGRIATSDGLPPFG